MDERVVGERRYRLDNAYMTYEDELPEDMTDADYEAWFDESYVDGVRIGPGVFRLPDSAEGSLK
jgi:hypothetical protein